MQNYQIKNKIFKTKTSPWLVVVTAIILFLGSIVFTSSAFAVESTFTTSLTTTGLSTLPPSIPTNLLATAVSDTQIDLSWTASVPNYYAIGGYRIFRDSIFLATTTSNIYSDTSLTPVTPYSYTVEAFDTLLQMSGRSATSTATTTATPIPTPTPSTGGGGSSGGGTTGIIISNIRIVPGANQAEISFTTNVPTQTKVQWGFSQDFELGSLQNLFYGYEHTQVITGLSEGLTYQAKLSANNAIGASVSTNVSFTTILPITELGPLPNPSDFLATATDKDINLTWINPEDPRFNDVRIVRTEGFYPIDQYDGIPIYEGDGESFVDTTAKKGVTYYYAIFSRSTDGEYSSGALAQARIAIPGEEPVTAVVDPFANLPQAKDVHPMIKALTLADFEFIQDGKNLATVVGNTVAIDGGKNLTIRLKYDKVPEILKTVAFTLEDPSDKSKVFPFLLRVNKDKTYYEATIGALGRSGRYGMSVAILDYENNGLMRLNGTLAALAFASPLLDFGKNFDFLGLLILLLFIILIILAIMLLKRWVYYSPEHEVEKKPAYSTQTGSTSSARRIIVGVLALIFAQIFIFGFSSSALAAFNPEINYQGKLVTSTNSIVPDGSYNIRFKLYTTLSGGSPIWTETWCNTSDCAGTGVGDDIRISIVNGLFSTMLGSTTAFTGVDFNQPLYLGVEIGGSGATAVWDGEMSPRKILGAVPAAFYAGTSTVALSANTLDGLDSGQFFRNDTQNATSSSSTFLNILQSGAGKIAEFFGSASQSVLALLSNGNVGIGTTSPYAKLSVVGETVSTYFTATSTTATTTLAGGLSVAGSSGLTVLQNGNVGVGMMNPAYKFDVLGYINTDIQSGYKQGGTTILYATSTRTSVFVGAQAGNSLIANTAGGGLLTAVGHQAMFNATSSSYGPATAIGYRALYGTATQNIPIYTTAIGNSAFRDLKSGSSNVAIGEEAAMTASACTYCIAIGRSTLNANTTGTENIGIGFQALNKTTTGSSNFAAGRDSLLNNTTGGNNFALGFSSLQQNLTGSGNIAIGISASQYNFSATNTIAIGYAAGTGSANERNASQNNVWIGYQAGNRIRTGQGNVGIGYYGGYGGDVLSNRSTTVDNFSTFIGYQASRSDKIASTTVLTGAVAIGYNAMVGASYSMALGGEGAFSTKVGIGTSTPWASLSIAGGSNATDPMFTISTSTASATTTAFIIDSNGKVGIGTTSPYAKLSVVGSSDLGNSALAGYFVATTTAASIFPYASTTALTVSGTNGLQLATGLNGPLQAMNGLVSATTSIGVLYGGTGLTTAPSYGQLLMGNASSGYTLTATSSLGISLSSIIGNFGQSWEISNNIFSQSSLSPTTTQNIAVSGIGTSTFAGGLEAWRQIASPYFSATSTTATSTFPNLSLSRMLFGSDYLTDITGTGLAISNGALSVTGLAITGAANMLAGFDASGNLTSTSSPQVAYINATSTTATSTFAGGVSTGGFISTFNNSGTIAVTASTTGITTYFKATADTDVARGIALTDAFTASQAGDVIEVGPGQYRPASTMSIKSYQTIYFNSSHIYTPSVTSPIFTSSNSDYWSMKGSGLFEGNGTTTLNITHEIGINVINYARGWVIDGLSFKNLRGAGIRVDSSIELPYRHDGGTISNVNVYGSGYGLYVGSNAEYLKITNSSFWVNTVGVYAGSGNITLSNSNISDNLTGLYVDTGANNGHGIVSGNHINHNTVYGVYMNNITIGMSFTGNNLFGSGSAPIIYLNASRGVNFVGGIMGAPFIIQMSGTFTGYNSIKNVWFNGEPTILASNTQRPYLRLENNYNTGSITSNQNSGQLLEMGGTGSTIRPNNGSIPFADSNGNYIYDNNRFGRDLGGLFTQIGDTSFTNVGNALTIQTGTHDNKGLIVRGSNDASPDALDPSAISGLEFWFKADSLNLNNGDSVTTWTDSSGNARNATQATTALKPVYKTSVLNGKPVIRFNGGQYMTSSSVTKAQPLTYFVVAREDVLASTTLNKTPFHWNHLLFNFTSGTTGTFYAGANLSFPATSTNWNIYDVVADGASSAISVNGSSDTVGNAGTGSASGAFTIGAHGGASNYEWPGDIAEIIAYSGRLSDSNRESIRRYLQAKYGLSITKGDSATWTEQANNLQEWQNASSSAMAVVDGSGKFGIGTTTPYSKLSVWGSSTGTNRLFELTNSASTTLLSFLENGTGYFLGNIGIGTTSPFAKLSVAGIGSFDDYVRASYFTATSTTATSTFPNLSLTNLLFGSDYLTDITGTGLAISNGALSVTGMAITGAANMLAGFDASGNLTSTSSPQVAYINATSTTATSTFAGGLSVAGSTGLNVLQNGNIGIGTSSPQSKLALSGGNFTHLASGNPALKGVYNTTGLSKKVYISDRYAYVADGTGGIQIIDISNPSAPTLVSTYNYGGNMDTNGIRVSGKYAYVSDTVYGLAIIDVSNPYSPNLVSYDVSNGSAYGVYISGKYAYLSSGAAWIMFDISNPLVPVVVSSYPASDIAWNPIFVSGKYLFATDITAGLQIIDISDISAPVLAGNYDSSGEALGVYVSGKSAYLADGLSGLQIINISNPASPTLVGTYDTGGNASHVQVFGNYAYVADDTSGLIVIDVLDPANPKLIGTYNTSGNALGVYISGKYAYVADGASGLQIVDINGIEAPSISVGNIAANAITIAENADFGNNLFVRNGLDVGMGGIFTDGVLSVAGTSSSYFGGNVGIGTTSPFAKLSVAGIGSFDNYIRASYFVATSTTASIFPYASTTALTVSGTNGLQLASGLNGPLQAINGLVSSTSTLSIGYGGTGTSTAPSYGQLLVGDGNGGYNLAATSTLGILASSAIGMGTQGFVPYYAGSVQALTATSSLYISQSSFIGIGTTTPTSALSVFSASSPQFQLAYNKDNYLTTGVSSSGGVTMAVNGSAGGFAITNPQPTAVGSGTGTAAPLGFSVTGGIGGNSLDTNIGVGGVGGGIQLNAGAGGTAVLSTFSETGGAGGTVSVNGGSGGNASSPDIDFMSRVAGAGGLFSFIAGAGGNATNGGLASSNTAGAGGTFTLKGGAGGNASGATTNNGGAGGSMYLSGGAGGTGSTANGTAGNLYLGYDGSSAIGNVYFGNQSASYISSTGNFGIGTTSPYAKLSVAGGSLGTTPLFAISTSTASATSTAFIIDSQGRVGIGSSTPTGIFAIQTSSSANKGFYFNASNQFVAPVGGTATLPSLAFISGASMSGINSANGAALTYSLNGTNVLTMQRPSRSNIRISNPNASADIHIWSGNEATTAGQLYLAGAGNSYLTTGAGMLTIGSSTPYAKLAVYGNAGETNSILFAIASSTATATTTHFLVNNAGNVGIGTTSPYANLSVAGGAGQASDVFAVSTSTSGFGTSTAFKIASTGTVTAHTILPWGDLKQDLGASTNRYSNVYTTTIQGGNNTLTTIAGTASVLKFCANNCTGTSQMYLMSASGNGGLTIGTSTAVGYARLQVRGVGSGTAQTVEIYNSASTTLMRILDNGTTYFNGNVGIGTTSPYAMLSVAGEAVFEKFTATSTTATSTIYGFLDVLGTGTNATSTFTSNLWVKGGLKIGLNSIYLSETGITYPDRFNTTFRSAASTTIANNTNFAWTIATSSDATPIFQIDTTGNMATTTIGGIGAGNVTIGDASSPTNLLFGSSASILGGGTNTITFGQAGDKFNFAVNLGIGSSTPYSALTVGSGNIGAFNGAICADNGGTAKCFASLTAGTVYGDASSFAASDLAENYSAGEDGLEAGDVVMLTDEFSEVELNKRNSDISYLRSKYGPNVPSQLMDSLNIGVVKASDRAKLLGVVSTQPGVLLGDATGEELKTSIKPIALAGRVPVKVNNKGGIIKKGDFITLSSIKGIGMKATTTGRTIGIALEDFSGVSGKINVLVNLGSNVFDSNIALATSTASTTSTGSSTIPSSVQTMADAIVALDLKVDALVASSTIDTDLVISSTTMALINNSDFVSSVSSSTANVLSSNDSFVQSIANAVKNIISSTGDWVIDRFTAKVAYVNRVEAETVAISKGMEIIDQISGAIWCVTIKNGDWNKIMGTCASSATSTISVSTPTPTPIPLNPEPTPIVSLEPTPSIEPVSTSSPSITPEIPSDLSPTPTPTSSSTPVVEPTPSSSPTPIPSVVSTPVPSIDPNPSTTPVAPQDAPAPAPVEPTSAPEPVSAPAEVATPIP